MREVNFSIPCANKASVGITTALYDRRALDCTSTLPLINSLNHLAYLTTSSARIRDILTVDGGVERLVVILKEGRCRELMSMWKWNLAFQCVVNIGVRGSEAVRTRVVEADMVPVIATILDNYIQVMDKTAAKRNAAAAVAQNTRAREHRTSSISGRRSGAPHIIDIPPNNQVQVDFLASVQRGGGGGGGHGGQIPRYQPSHGRAHDNRQGFQSYITPTVRDPSGLQLMDLPVASDFNNGIQPVRDRDRLPSMLQTGGPSQPASPTTPNPPIATITGGYHDRAVHRSSRFSLRHQRSMSGESDDANSDEATAPAAGNELIVDILQPTVDIERDSMLESVDAPMAMTLPHGADPQDEAETFNITHWNQIDGSIINPTGPANPAMGFSPNQPPANPALSITGSLQMPSRYAMEGPSLLPSMPREEDVLMSLQLLAYVSKYCNLRSYFQKSHLVPRLSIDREIHLLDDGPGRQNSRPKKEEQEEYDLQDNLNIFPLVEKFTVRHHPPDMQYWAGVVMRNLCRKDENKGGIRQCAYYECGKWEAYTRQFAKCRRCRRTKYCSKDCQKNAWVYHRHWCVAAHT